MQLSNEDSFLNKFEPLFDIAHVNAVDLIENDEDKLFLKNHRKRGCLGCIVTLDKVIFTRRGKAGELQATVEKKKTTYTA